MEGLVDRTAGSKAQVKQGRRSQVAVKCPAIFESS
jgi:hypothetical protein